ncbi:MAG: hypothetical protein O7I42_10400 [Alphaproteobacteria bacterium]|nr:hypothetical protein [Alphaproteobacteria bacterium]
MSDKKAKEYWDRRKDRIDEILESWRTSTEFAATALKSAILLNGAAAVAVLAFFAKQDGASTILSDPATSLRHFVIGAFSGVLATGFGYLSALAENRSLWRWVERGPHTSNWERFQYFCVASAIVCVIYAYVRFWLGMEVGSATFLGG